MTDKPTSLLWRMLFSKGKGVKIDPDFLPGLRAPRPAPRLPIARRKPPVTEGPDLDAVYARYLASGARKKRKRPNDRGMKF
jgi:hypothetical protein